MKGKPEMPFSLIRHHLLLVDDDPFQLKLISRQLNNLGVEQSRVNTFLNGVDALAYLQENAAEHALILLDLNMPEMDGVEFVRLLVEQSFAGALVLVSGEDRRILETTAMLARARRLNVLGHLDKPVQPDALKVLLERWRTQVNVTAGQTRKTYSGSEVGDAIARGQLFNLYQPKVDIATGAFIGVEALVRWRHPQDGIVFPDQFIGVAEEHGLIDVLTGVVLAEALAESVRWREAGLALRVSVNVSTDNLTNLDFPTLLLDEIARSGAVAADLILEVTESRLMKDLLVPLDILTRLRLKQISLSIDDFGTGHSSLAQLRDIPFDELKIDRSFVHGAANNSTLRSIFDASLTMAAQLGMKVVAEGVEDRTDWDFLRARSCDLAQGYFIAKPMPAAELPTWHASWEARRGEFGPRDSR